MTLIALAIAAAGLAIAAALYDQAQAFREQTRINARHLDMTEEMWERQIDAILEQNAYQERRDRREGECHKRWRADAAEAAASKKRLAEMENEIKASRDRLRQKAKEAASETPNA